MSSLTREAFLKTWGRGRLLTKIDVSHEPVFLLAAVSGGRDSVLLLEALSDLVEQDMLAEGSELVICHVHHGIREQASRDAAFVQDLAERKGLRFILQMGSAPALAQKGKRGLEAAARQLRYAAFVSCLEDEGFQPLNGDCIAALGKTTWGDAHMSSWPTMVGIKPNRSCSIYSVEAVSADSRACRRSKVACGGPGLS